MCPEHFLSCHRLFDEVKLQVDQCIFSRLLSVWGFNEPNKKPCNFICPIEVHAFLDWCLRPRADSLVRIKLEASFRVCKSHATLVVSHLFNLARENCRKKGGGRRAGKCEKNLGHRSYFAEKSSWKDSGRVRSKQHPSPAYEYVRAMLTPQISAFPSCRKS